MKITDIPVAHFSSYDDHKLVRFFEDPASGLKAIIALHNTHLGPGFGGCRFYPYADMDAAIEDVLRLSRGMTYKSALAGLPLGGGKSVIIGNPKTDKTPAMMRAFGAAIETLNGQYITAEDVGTTDDDMVEISQATNHVSGLPHSPDAKHELAGNPSPITAYGVVCGVRAAIQHVFGHQDVSRLHFAIQGLGAVGYAAAEYLLKDGARLTVADLDAARAQKLSDTYKGQVTIGDTKTILFTQADVLMPCAMGGILNDDTIPSLRTKIIAGAANNQLGSARHDQMLKDHGILYAPDYVINSGGIVAVAYQYFARRQLHTTLDLTHAGIWNQTEKIYATTARVLDVANVHNQPTGFTADNMARSIFEA
jgi:leucine dehydrogenase